MRNVGERCHRKRLFFWLRSFARRSLYNDMKIKESHKVILLGIEIGNYRSTSYKLHGNCRTRKYVTLDKAKLPYSAFVNSASLVMPP